MYNNLIISNSKHSLSSSSSSEISELKNKLKPFFVSSNRFNSLPTLENENSVKTNVTSTNNSSITDSQKITFRYTHRYSCVVLLISFNYEINE